MTHDLDRNSLFEAIQRLYRNPDLHPPLTRSICPLHDAAGVEEDDDVYRCPACGTETRYRLLSEGDYLRAYCAAEAAGDPGAVARLEEMQDVAALLWKVSAVRRALERHPLKGTAIRLPNLCGPCGGRPRPLNIGLDAPCLLCLERTESILDPDGVQEFLTALWFQPAHAALQVLSTKLPVAFAIAYFFCRRCRSLHFPAPYREPEYRFVD